MKLVQNKTINIFEYYRLEYRLTKCTQILCLNNIFIHMEVITTRVYRFIRFPQFDFFL